MRIFKTLFVFDVCSPAITKAVGFAGGGSNCCFCCAARYWRVRRGPSTGSGRCLEGAVNIGCPQYVTVDEAASLSTATAIEVSGKEIHVEHVEGPVGVHSRNFAQGAHQVIGVGS
jgi:hypothetical protein